MLKIFAGKVMNKMAATVMPALATLWPNEWKISPGVPRVEAMGAAAGVGPPTPPPGGAAGKLPTSYFDSADADTGPVASLAVTLTDNRSPPLLTPCNL